MPFGLGEPEEDESSGEFMDALGFAEGRDVSTRDARTWRVAVLVVLTCLVALASAILLLDHRGGQSHLNADVVFPSTTPTERVAPAPESFGLLPTAAVSTAPHPVRKLLRTTRAAPSSTVRMRPTSSARSQPPVAPPTTSTLPAPPTTPTPTPTPSPARTVTLAKGPRDQICQPHCYFLVVRLTNFVGEQHVECFSSLDPSVPFDSYDTPFAVSDNCYYNRPGATVWVLVDGVYKSNELTW